MAGTVLERLYVQVNSTDGCQITSSIMDRTTGSRIGFRAYLQMDYGGSLKAVLTGFKYLPDEPESIGVMEKLAKIGAGENRHIIVYFDDRDIRQSMVFHPQAHLEHGIPEAKDADRMQRGERWLNLPRSWAVSLREFAEGAAEPREEPTQQEEVERDGGWFSV